MATLERSERSEITAADRQSLLDGGMACKTDGCGRLTHDLSGLCCRACERTSGAVHGPFCHQRWQLQQQMDELMERNKSKFWRGRELAGGEDELFESMNPSIRDDALHIVFVDALYLHKAIFEFDEGDVDKKRKDAVKGLNAMAFGLFSHGTDTSRSLANHPTSPQFDVKDEVTEFVRWGCCELLASSSMEAFGSTKEELDAKRYHNYPFDPDNRERWVHLDRLKQIWGKPNFVDMIPGILERLGPHRRMKLLSAMCVQVPKDLLCWKEFHYFVKTCPVKLAKGSWSKNNPLSEDNPPKDVASVHPSIPDAWLKQGHRSRVVVFYTEVQGVLCHWKDIFPKSCSFTANLQVVKLAKAISAADDDNNNAQVYSLPFTQAMAENLWDLAWPFFCWNRAMDIFFQILLSVFITPASHNIILDAENSTSANHTSHNGSSSGFHYIGTESLHEEWVWVTVIVYLGGRSMIVTLMELTSLAFLYRKDGKKKDSFKFALYGICQYWWNSYRVVNFLIEVFAFFVMCLLFNDFVLGGASNDAQSVLHEYPFRLTGLVFSKWCQLLLMFMNTYLLRETMLPAWNAVVSQDSMAFLIVLIALSSGAAMAYYALPIGETSKDTTWHLQEYLHPFFVMSRLNLMGDISSDISGDKDYPEDSSEHFKWALNFFIVFCGVLFPVVSLNLYVGVLSAAYEKQIRPLRCLIHAEGQLHSTTACRLLLALRFYPLRFFMSHHRTFSTSVWTKYQVGENKNNVTGTWIAIPEHRFDTELDSDHVDISDTLSIMRFKLEEDAKTEEQESGPQRNVSQDPSQREEVLEAISALKENMEKTLLDFEKTQDRTETKALRKRIADLEKEKLELQQKERDSDGESEDDGSGIGEVDESAKPKEVQIKRLGDKISTAEKKIERKRQQIKSKEQELKDLEANVKDLKAQKKGLVDSAPQPQESEDAHPSTPGTPR